jgi:signal transduction histidine kinase
MRQWATEAPPIPHHQFDTNTLRWPSMSRALWTVTHDLRPTTMVSAVFVHVFMCVLGIFTYLFFFHATDLQTERASSDNFKPGQTFVPKGTRNTFKKRISKANKEEERRKLEEEEASLRRLRIAEEEAEAERQRVAEADAEAVWIRLMRESGEQGGDE